MATEKSSFWQTFKSVLAAFIGVQSNKNRERDFQHGEPVHFIVIGLLLTIVFIFIVWGVVKLVLSVAGV